MITHFISAIILQIAVSPVELTRIDINTEQNSHSILSIDPVRLTSIDHRDTMTAVVGTPRGSFIKDADVLYGLSWDARVSTLPVSAYENVIFRPLKHVELKATRGQWCEVPVNQPDFLFVTRCSAGHAIVGSSAQSMVFSLSKNKRQAIASLSAPLLSVALLPQLHSPGTGVQFLTVIDGKVGLGSALIEPRSPRRSGS